MNLLFQWYEGFSLKKQHNILAFYTQRKFDWYLKFFVRIFFIRNHDKCRLISQSQICTDFLHLNLQLEQHVRDNYLSSTARDLASIHGLSFAK